jgi:methylamine dehydrogenase heavy chain
MRVFVFYPLMGIALLTRAALADFQPEPLGQVATIPTPYPAGWLVVHDLAFDHMREGRFYLVDPDADSLSGQMRGIMSGDFIASFVTSAQRGEHYVIESFHARGGRGGKRTDVVSIYDPATLSVVDEVIIPAKRLTGMPNRYAVALLAGDRFLAVYNFTPVQSVSIVDLQTRKFVGEIGIPGCAFVYPTGARSFSSLCSDGGLLITHLDAAGIAEGTDRLEPFNDVIDDAMFEKPAMIGGVAYFPTFTGNVVPVDLRGRVAEVGAKWSLTTEQERAAGWRPGGAWPAVGGEDGRLYVLMHGHGAEGTHKDGGDQVWVYDVASGTRQQIIKLASWGIALSRSGGEPARLVVTGAEPTVDIYDAASGNYVKTLAISAATPLLVHAVR